MTVLSHNAAELGVAPSLLDGKGSVDAAKKREATDKREKMFYRYIELSEATEYKAGTLAGTAHTVTKENWAVQVAVNTALACSAHTLRANGSLWECLLFSAMYPAHHTAGPCQRSEPVPLRRFHILG